MTPTRPGARLADPDPCRTVTRAIAQAFASHTAKTAAGWGLYNRKISCQEGRLELRHALTSERLRLVVYPLSQESAVVETALQAIRAERKRLAGKSNARRAAA